MNVKFIVCVSILLSLPKVFAAEIEGFPEACSDASTREPLPGHIIRLGSVNEGPNGLYFAFPDQNDTTNLQTIDLADNVGLIGQDPNQDLSEMIQNTTPSGSFVVAQVFVGDENQEPVVTCLSRVMPLTQYVPADFGPEWSWLERGYFYERLRYKKYHRHWGWKKWWRNKFHNLRDRYRKDYGDRYRFRDRDDRRRDRGDRQMIIRRDNKKNIGRDKDNKMIIRKPTDGVNRDINRGGNGNGFKNREHIMKPETKKNTGTKNIVKRTKPINPNTVRIDRGEKDTGKSFANNKNTMVIKRDEVKNEKRTENKQ